MAEFKMMKLSIDEIDDEDLYLQLQRYLILNPRFQQSFHSVTSYLDDTPALHSFAPLCTPFNDMPISAAQLYRVPPYYTLNCIPLNSTDRQSCLKWADLQCTLLQCNGSYFCTDFLWNRSSARFYCTLFNCTVAVKCSHSARWQLLSLHWIARNS